MTWQRSALAAREAALIARYGWAVRAYVDTPWAHTVGLRASYGHPEISLRLAIAPDRRLQWLNVFGRAVRAGRRFAAGETVPDLFSVPVRIVARDAGLHLVLPDAQGYWPEDPACAAGFADQLRRDGP
jgi:hypothetical protein